MDSATPSGDGTGIAEPSARKGFWSFVSDDESVERGQVNFWAIAETLLAIGVFWYVALEWETFFLLYTSLFIAPLLFLRSEKSVEHGVIWLSEGSFPAKKMSESRVVLEWFEAREKERRTRWLAAGIGIAVGVGVSVALGYLMAKAFLVGYEGWAGFWRGLVLGYFFIAIVGTLVVAVHITLTGTAGITTRSAQAVALVVAGFEALAGMVAVAGAGAGALVALFIPLVLLLRRAILDEFMLGCMAWTDTGLRSLPGLRPTVRRANVRAWRVDRHAARSLFRHLPLCD